MINKSPKPTLSLSEVVFQKNEEFIISEIFKGSFNLDHFVDTQEDTILISINEDWEGLIGTSNPYWDREMINDSDIRFLIGRFKHDLCLKLPELIKNHLRDKYIDYQRQYVETLTRIKDTVVRLCESSDIGTSQELLDLQSSALSLQVITTNIEKARLYFTAQQLNLDPVEISTLLLPSDLIVKASPREISLKANSEVAAAASTQLTSQISPDDAKAALSAEELIQDTNDTSTSITQHERSGRDTEDNLDLEIGSIHIFERALVNGFVNTIKEKPAFIPERRVREKGFEHGDKLIVTERQQVGDKMHYEFELVEKSNTPALNRIEFNWCIVEEEEVGLFVDKHQSGQNHINLFGKDYKIQLSQQDILRLKISVGDIIDIACRPNNPGVARVVWKHHT